MVRQFHVAFGVAAVAAPVLLLLLQQLVLPN